MEQKGPMNQLVIELDHMEIEAVIFKRLLSPLESKMFWTGRMPINPPTGPQVPHWEKYGTIPPYNSAKSGKDGEFKA